MRRLSQVAGISLISLSLVGMTGCQSLKHGGLFGKKTEMVESKAKNSEQGYYQDAQNQMNKRGYAAAIKDLNDLRTYYPVGKYSEQALLDIMYAQFQHGDYLDAVASADRFIQLYPTNPQVDYAYYVRGVANMQTIGSGFAQYTSLNQAHRDTGYAQLAFNNFQELIGRFPNSAYAPDAAQRMRYLYNQFAESEMDTARWYIKRKAYVAAASRARWVFQYYPQSVQIPEAIATLAYSYDKLGMGDTAKQYKQLLAINYPQLLDKNGNVKLQNSRTKSSVLNAATLGVFGRSSQVPNYQNANTANGTIATKPQQIQSLQALQQQQVQQARQLQLPTSTPSDSGVATSVPDSNGVKIGLGLPADSVERTSSISSVSDNVAKNMIQENPAPTKTPTPNLNQQP